LARLQALGLSLALMAGGVCSLLACRPLLWAYCSDFEATSARVLSIRTHAALLPLSADYEFEVNGKAYRGNADIAASERALSSTGEWVYIFPGSIEVRYDPRNPLHNYNPHEPVVTRFVLRPFSILVSLSLCLWGVLFFCFGFVLGRPGR